MEGKLQETSSISLHFNSEHVHNAMMHFFPVVKQEC